MQPATRRKHRPATCCTTPDLGKHPRKKVPKKLLADREQNEQNYRMNPRSSAPRTRLHPARPGTIHLQHPVRYAGHRTQTTTTDDTTPSDMPARQKTHTLRVRSENRQTAPTQPPNTSPTFSEVPHSVEEFDRTSVLHTTPPDTTGTTGVRREGRGRAGGGGGRRRPGGRRQTSEGPGGTRRRAGPARPRSGRSKGTGVGCDPRRPAGRTGR